MPKEIKDLTKVARLTICNNQHSISEQIQMMSVDNANGDPDAEYLPKEATIIRVALAVTIIKIKVADGAVITIHGSVVITMASSFGEHMIKCVILKDDNNDHATYDIFLEEISKEERVSFCEDKSDTFSQIEEIEAEQLVRHPKRSIYQLPS
uniref:Uncharacterized protein n=1 Tax=Romanomermis culicivorax TaxID=13658 RepID=A0A915INY9_ROMCU